MFILTAAQQNGCQEREATPGNQAVILASNVGAILVYHVESNTCLWPAAGTVLHTACQAVFSK